MPWLSLLAGLWLALGGIVSMTAAQWQSLDGFRILSVQPVSSGRTGFVHLEALSLGVTFTNLVSEARIMTNRNLGSGSGVALGDVDGDGWVDVFLCGMDSAPKLFRNQGGWRFGDWTSEAFGGGEFRRIGGGWDSTGAVLADVDGDGDLDLLLNALGQGTRLWLNDGSGHFREATDEWGLRSRTGATSMALADVDGDGDLDLYVCNFRPDTVMDRPSVKFSLRNQGGRPVVTAVDGRPTSDPDLTNRFELGPDGQVLEFGEPDVLWINNGKGRFTPASWTDGTFLDEDGRRLTHAYPDWGLAAHLSDLNGDGRPDLYVCNDLHTPDRLWINVSTNGRAVPLRPAAGSCGVVGDQPILRGAPAGGNQRPDRGDAGGNARRSRCARALVHQGAATLHPAAAAARAIGVGSRGQRVARSARGRPIPAHA